MLVVWQWTNRFLKVFFILITAFVRIQFIDFSPPETCMKVIYKSLNIFLHASWMHGCVLLYPMQQVAKGMFLTLQNVSVSQSVSPLVNQSVRQSVRKSISPFFFVSTTPLKLLNRNFVVMKDILCRCAYSHFWQNMDIIVQRYIILCRLCDTGLARVHEFKWLLRSCL